MSIRTPLPSRNAAASMPKLTSILNKLLISFVFFHYARSSFPFGSSFSIFFLFKHTKRACSIIFIVIVVGTIFAGRCRKEESAYRQIIKLKTSYELIINTSRIRYAPTPGRLIDDIHLFITCVHFHWHDIWRTNQDLLPICDWSLIFASELRTPMIICSNTCVCVCVIHTHSIDA